MDDPSDASGVNLSAIRFPSDKLTVGMLRRLYPARLNIPLPTFFDSDPYDNSAAYVLGNLLAAERALAMDAYNRAAGEAWKDVGLGFDRHTFASDLADYYVEYGLAPGLRSAEQLVRGIETQAAQQARGRG